jgi:hypothetical protein
MSEINTHPQNYNNHLRLGMSTFALLASGLTITDAMAMQDSPAAITADTISHQVKNDFFEPVPAQNSTVGNITVKVEGSASNSTKAGGELISSRIHHHVVTPGIVFPGKSERPNLEQTTLANFPPKSQIIPEKVQAIIKENVAYLPFAGCSGFLIRNNAGEAIGVRTAQHCDLLPISGSSTRKIDGGYYTFLDGQEPVQVYTGDSTNSLTLAGTVSKFLIDSEPNFSTGGPDKDSAIGVFEGQSPKEVLAANDNMVINPDELVQGETIYNAGFPIDPKNPNSQDKQEPIKRQSFVMTYLGHARWDLTNGENLDLAIAAMPEAKDGSECSWGNSGSAGFILDPNGQVKIIGSQTAFNDFGHLLNRSGSAGEYAKLTVQDQFHVNMTGYSAVCGFAYQMPSAKDRVVSTPEFIGNFVNRVENQPLVDLLKINIQNPNYQRQIINGIVQLNIPGQALIDIDNPIYSYDQNSQTLALGWWIQAKEGNPLYQTISLSGKVGLSFLNIIANKNMETPDISTTSNGPMTVLPNLGGYMDAKGLLLGESYSHTLSPSLFENSYSVTDNNGSLVLVPPKA